MQQRTRRKIWWTTAGVVVVVAGVAVGVLVWLKSDTARPVTVEDVVADFRRASTSTSSTTTSMSMASVTSMPSTTSAPVTTPPAPLRAGVYVYDTVGSERVDALGGSDHAYPVATTVTVTHDDEGCVTTRWDALDQRWDEARFCPHADGWALASRTVYHSFFQQSDERAFDCAPDSLHLPTDHSLEATFSASCTSGGTAESGASDEVIAGRIVGSEQVDVDGQAVETVHVRYEATIGGESTGLDVVDRWYALGTPLLIVREVRAGQNTTQTPIGAVVYTESYELTLQRLEPLS